MRRESIELLLDWLAALRGDDGDRAATGLAADVEWRGVREELVCSGRDEVVRRFRADRGDLREVEAIELIGQDTSAVLAAHDGSGDEIYDVFRFDHGRIVRIEDYARREDAMAAAGSPAAGSPG
jgi:hypothetical protein